MKRMLTHTALALGLALGLSAPAAMAKGKTKRHSAEHMTAVRKCEDDYLAARKEARGKKGKERREAFAAARTARKQCIAAAPQ